MKWRRRPHDRVPFRGGYPSSTRPVEDLRQPHAPSADEILTGPGPLQDPPPKFDLGRPLSELRSSGILWLVNRAVLHPRGFALALHTVGDDRVTGWSLLGDGSEVWAFDEDDDDERFAAAEATLAQLRHPASVEIDGDDKPWPTWGTFSCGDCGMVKYNRGLRGGIARAFGDHLVGFHPDQAADLLAERFVVDHAGPNQPAETLVERPDPTRITTDGQKPKRTPSANPGAQ